MQYISHTPIIHSKHIIVKCGRWACGSKPQCGRLPSCLLRHMEKNERQGLAFFAPFEPSAQQIGVQRVEKSGLCEPPLTLVFRNVQLCRRSITALPSIPQEHTRFHLRYNKIPLYSILKSYALQLCTIYIVMPVIFWYNFTISSGNYNQKRSVLAMQKKLKNFYHYYLQPS